MKNAKDQGNEDVKPNALITVPLPPSSESSLNSQLTKTSFSISSIGYLKDYKFYISDEKVTRRAMVFSVAYNEAIKSKDNKKLCTCVGSMLCDVFPGFKSSVEIALEAIGVKPLFVKLPSQAREYNIVEAEVSQMDSCTILVYFSLCILLIFLNKSRIKAEGYNYSGHMDELKERAGCDPELNIPFDYKRLIAFRTMLGACPKLHSDVIEFLEGNLNNGDTRVAGVCQYIRPRVE